MRTDVLIVGAGPTGLVLALWLTKQGLTVRIVDRSAGPGETSRAMAVQARTLELYTQLGLTDAVVNAGVKNPSMNIWAGGKRKAHLEMSGAGEDVTPYPYILTYPQDLHEKLLIEHLTAANINVERQTELVGFEDKDDHVAATLRLPDGNVEVAEALYLAGCDGAKSPVRHGIGAGFEGGTYKQLFYVADVAVSGLEPTGEAHIALDSSDFVAVLSYGADRNRLIGIVQDERAEHPETLTFDDVSHAAIDGLGAKVEKVNWFSTYRVHHRVTDRFRQGRVFLLGDAAHVHSPAGGQGMNTGIADAINLAWKLTAVVREQAPETLLDSYQQERRAFANKLVDTTDKIFSAVTAQSDFANFIRTRIVPTVAGFAYLLDAPKEFMFRMISQTSLSYRDSALSAGEAGKVHGGDRLPWVRTATGDNYGPMSEIGWQVHVYGEASSELAEWTGRHNVPLHVFAWTPKHQKSGLAQDAAYLLRPDTYVAVANQQGSPQLFDSYLAERGITL